MAVQLTASRIWNGLEIVGSQIVGCPSILVVCLFQSELIMYEMYPDIWAVSNDPPSAGRPRRRLRKQHSVVPAILVAQAQKVAPARG